MDRFASHPRSFRPCAARATTIAFALFGTTVLARQPASDGEIDSSPVFAQSGLAFAFRGVARDGAMASARLTNVGDDGILVLCDAAFRPARIRT